MSDEETGNKTRGTGRQRRRDQGTEGQGVPRPGRYVGSALILVAAALAVAPQVLRGNSCGHDFDFHLVSWIDALASWRHGIFYPHWATTPNYNAGEPRFVFYPPLTWMMGAVLGTVLPWIRVPMALTFLLLAGTGLATRALGRLMLPDGAATLAGCIAIFSGYTLYTAYERSAFAELAGGIWIPLLLLLVLRETDSREQSVLRRWGVDGSAALLALVVAAAWLSNAPVGVMACYLLAGFAVVVAGTLRLWVPLLRAAVGGVLGLGLAAFYLVPAAVEQKWVDIRQATDDPGEQIQNSFLFGHHADPQLALHDVELRRVSWIALAMVVAVLVALLVSWRRGTLPARRWWIPLAVLPLAVLFLLLPLSLPVWDVLPKMRFLQFPWRWLVVLEAPLGIFVALALWASRRGRRVAILVSCGGVFLGLTVFAGRAFFEVCDEYDAVPGMLREYHEGNGFQGTDEYAPVGADNSLMAENLPAACLVKDSTEALGVVMADDPQPQWAASQKNCKATLADVVVADARHWRAQGMLPEGGYLVLRLRRYPAWRVRANGQTVADTGAREDGLVVVPVAAGPVEVSADWQATPDIREGQWISLVSLAVVAGVGVTTIGRKGGQLK